MTKLSFSYFFLFSLIFIPGYVFGQDITYAKQVLSALCSKEYHGRGYTHKGVKKTSKFIVSELKKDGTKKIGKSYFQNFKMPVCVIDNLETVKIDTNILCCGSDFIIYPGSASCSGTFTLLKLDKENMKDIFYQKLNETFLVIDTSLTNDKTLKESLSQFCHQNSLHAKGIITLVEKNTVQIQQSEQVNWVNMEIPVSSFPPNAKQIELNFKTDFIEKYKTRNVVAVIPGESDSIVVFTAHYDHLGELGTAFFPGANDNASGVAMVLDLCKTFSKEKPRYTLVFIFITGEEIGLIGSQWFVSHPLVLLEKIRFLINLDLLGSGEDGITVVNGSVFTKEFERLKNLNTEKNYVPVVKTRGAADNSDHAPFYHAGVKCFFIYAQGKTGPYHNIADTPQNLSLGKWEAMVNLIIDFVKGL
ncbi:MAG: hypothetical protein COX07_06270 [Bacteroidetes bacterium CG23_combo_of_CG06-09_8_20_14_all_32_9]|nr:MAG: hypothetical protein COX07_06270 [Bacteroidetes bacterium CG23_combo_of_CG06-09_8_20_14_all_32_9]